MKKLSLFLALVMLITTIGVPTLADDNSKYRNTSGTEVSETSVADTITKPYDTNVQVVAATDAQNELEAHIKNIIQVDGLSFKDLNGNGQLDVYEDWREEDTARAADLLSQMTLDEKIGTLWHASTGGTFTSLYPYTDDFLFSKENTVKVDDAYYVPMNTSTSAGGTTCL